jgi:hypothetical protein
MRSSTSASEIGRNRRIPRAAWLLIAACAAVALGVEGAARIALDRSSRIQRRTMDEYRAARTIGVDGRRADGHVLVVGNSLLEEGVEFPRLRDALAPWDARRFVVENTYYYDWLYGLKRLYREGARPDVVVLMLSVGQWMPSTTRGDYSAQYLFSMADLPAIARDLDLHPTQATDLFFANVSKFWGTRAELRNFVMGHLMPQVGTLMGALQPVNRKPMDNGEVTAVTRPRIERLKKLADDHGTELVLLIPPMLNPDDGAAGLMEAAKGEGVPVLVPVASGSFAADLYRDGFHLNQTGAALFTERVIEPLKQELRGGSGQRNARASDQE